MNRKNGFKEKTGKNCFALNSREAYNKEKSEKSLIHKFGGIL